METNYDAVIVGAGIAGAMIGWQLAQEGLKVLILEAGERGPARLQLVGAYAASDTKSLGSPYKINDDVKNIFFPEGEKDYDQLGPNNFKSTYVRRVGGSTWHFLGNMPRHLPNDFQLYSQYGVGIDWAIQYKDIEEWYCKAEKETGVSGNHKEWQDVFGAFRTDAFPMPEIWQSYSDSLFIKALQNFEIDGIPVIVRSTPQARNSQLYDDRPACAGNSTCVPICPIGAKYDATVHVRKAERSGALILEKAVAVKIKVKSDSGSDSNVQSILFRTYDKQQHEVSGKIFVLAAHAIESAKLLLMSPIGESEATVANSSDQVGRNLMDHLQGQVGAIASEPVFGFRGPPTTSGIDGFRDGEFRATRAAFRMSLGNDGMGRLESPTKTLENLVEKDLLFGKELKAKLTDRLSRLIRISYSAEMLPRADNRVLLSKQPPDALGIPKPALQMTLEDYNRKAFDYAREVIKSIFRRMNISEKDMVFDTNPIDPNFYSGAGHIMGTCRMGIDPKMSVVDAECRSHDHQNLFIVGASVFPTGGTANPTLTVAALALRAADSIKRQLKEMP